MSSPSLHIDETANAAVIDRDTLAKLLPPLSQEEAEAIEKSRAETAAHPRQMK